jgi:hypothetical protein
VQQAPLTQNSFEAHRSEHTRASVPLHVHVPPQLSQLAPFVLLSVLHPPQAFRPHVSSHQLSFKSALHCHVPQQPPQPLPSV